MSTLVCGLLLALCLVSSATLAVAADPTTPPQFLVLPAFTRLSGGTARPLALLEQMSAFTDGPAEGWLRGPAEHWAEELVKLARDLRFDGFVVSVAHEDQLGQTERFATDVVPVVRAALS